MLGLASIVEGGCEFISLHPHFSLGKLAIPNVENVPFRKGDVTMKFDEMLARERYDYNELTGEFLWRNPPPRAKKSVAFPGQPAGTIDKRDGCRMINLDGKMHRASHVAWLYVTGEWPERQIQYQDPSLPLPTRDRFSNLRMSGTAQELTANAVRQLFDYDPETGKLTWSVRRKGIRLGQIAGSPKKTTDGRVHNYVRIDGVDYPAARLVWMHVTGEWPKARLVFKNDHPLDLRWDNLVEGEFEHQTRITPIILEDERRSRLAKNQRRVDLKRHFGLTEAKYNAMHAAQNGCCAMCGSPETETRGDKVKWLAVDHDHKTGAVRDLLCKRCNMTIGYAREEAPVLLAGIAYLARHGNPEAALILHQIRLGRQAAAGMTRSQPR